MEAPGPEPLSARPAGAGWVRLALLFYGGMLAVAWLWRSGWEGQSLLYASPEAALRGVRWLPDVALGFVAGLGTVLVSDVFTRRSQMGRRLARTLAGALGPITRREGLLLALASGLGEEALFRGALQPVVGLLAASVLFGLVHFAPRRDLWPWSLFALAGGLGLGALFAGTGNLVAPFVAHATLNAVNLRKLVRDYGPGIGSPTSER
jgi:hypothetical protein